MERFLHTPYFFKKTKGYPTTIDRIEEKLTLIQTGMGLARECSYIVVLEESDEGVDLFTLPPSEYMWTAPKKHFDHSIIK